MAVNPTTQVVWLFILIKNAVCRRIFCTSSLCIIFYILKIDKVWSYIKFQASRGSTYVEKISFFVSEIRLLWVFFFFDFFIFVFLFQYIEFLQKITWRSSAHKTNILATFQWSRVRCFQISSLRCHWQVLFESWIKEEKQKYNVFFSHPNTKYYLSYISIFLSWKCQLQFFLQVCKIKIIEFNRHLQCTTGF